MRHFLYSFLATTASANTAYIFSQEILEAKLFCDVSFKDIILRNIRDYSFEYAIHEIFRSNHFVTYFILLY